MAGSGGGATAQSTIPDYIQNMHGLVLAGAGGVNRKTWQGGTHDLGEISYCYAYEGWGGVGYVEGDQLQVGVGGGVVTVAVVGTYGTVVAVEVKYRGQGYSNAQVYDTVALTGAGTNCELVVMIQQMLYDQSGSYKQCPSILRFLHERGLTDVGGNPYENTETYDYGDDTARMQNEVDQFRSAVLALDPQADFSSIMTTAKMLSADSIATIDTDGALDAASARAVSVFTDMLIKYTPQITSLFLESTEQSKYVVRNVVTEMLAVATEVLASTVLEEAVTVYRSKALTEHLRGVNRFAGGMADINAVNSSAFVIGMSLLESGFETNVLDFRSKLTLGMFDKSMSAFTQVISSIMGALPSYLSTHIQAFLDHTRINSDALLRSRMTEYGDKSSFMNGAINTMMNALNAKVDQSRNIVAAQLDFGKTSVILGKEKADGDLELLVKESDWDLEMFQKASNIISAVSGGIVAMPTGPTRTQSVVGGLLAGAGAGAQIGAMSANPLGPVIGGAIGGLAGLIGGVQG